MITSLFPFPFVSLAGASSSPSGCLATLFDPLFAVSFNNQEIIGLVAIVGGMLLGGVIVTTVLYFNHQKQRLWHETARLALERGQPLPPYPATDEERASQPPAGVSYREWRCYRRGRGLKGGLILIAVGLGIGVASGRTFVAGAIPALIGVALVINALIEMFWNNDSAGRPPRT